MRSLEERRAMKEFPAITFQDGPTGRRAVLQGGPDVWEIIWIAELLSNDEGRIAAHFQETITSEQLEQAKAYTRRYPDDIRQRIAYNSSKSG